MHAHFVEERRERAVARVDAPARATLTRVPKLLVPGIMIALSIGLVWGGVARDLGDAEATLGIAATERVSAFGLALGGWVVELPAARVLPSWLVSWAYGDDANGWNGLVHLPALIAGICLSWMGMRRARALAGDPAAVLCGVALACSLALNERPWRLGFDPVLGLCLVAALDRILTRGSDLRAGLWMAAATLMGGWPALLIVTVPTVILGRAGAYLSWRLLIPPIVSFGAWSAWAIATTNPEAWAASLAGPIKQPMAWGTVPWVVALGLPWTPFAALMALPSVRARWSPATRRHLSGWLQVAFVLAIAATLLPGLAGAAIPILFALIVTASCALGDVWSGRDWGRSRMAVLVATFAVCAVVSLVGIPYATYLAAAVPYYRTIGIVIAVALTLVLAFAAVGAWEGRARWAIGCLVGLSVVIKCAHAEIYTPEWNYRISQAPSGRAIGQWVPPRAPIYTTHPWSAELAFATGRSVRTLVSPQWLEFVATRGPHYVLLSQSEFDHWPKAAPKIERVRAFEDAIGRVNVLARTVAPVPDGRAQAH